MGRSERIDALHAGRGEVGAIARDDSRIPRERLGGDHQIGAGMPEMLVRIAEATRAAAVTLCRALNVSKVVQRARGKDNPHSIPRSSHTFSAGIANLGAAFRNRGPHVLVIARFGFLVRPGDPGRDFVVPWRLHGPSCRTGWIGQARE
jgi:hypothetical protein